MVLPLYKTGPLKPGMMVITEGDNGLISRTIKKSTNSPYTHAFMVVEPWTRHSQGLLVEAWFPQGVRTTAMAPRLQQMIDEGRQVVVLDGPFRPREMFTDDIRNRVVQKALSFQGRGYDVGQAALYFFKSQFKDDGEGRMVCSRLMTAAWYRNYRPLFTEDYLLEYYGRDHPRFANLMQQWATPADLLMSRARMLGYLRGAGIYKLKNHA